MKILFTYSCIFYYVACTFLFGEKHWETDLEVAKIRAEKEGKDLLVEFTGSTWCRACNVFEKNVLKHPDFKGAENFILVVLDFPKDKSKLSKELLRLKKQYLIGVFPTIYLMDHHGKPYAKVAKLRMDVHEYNKHLKFALNYKNLRDLCFLHAKEVRNDVEKEKYLYEGLTALLDTSAVFYPQKLSQLRALNPDKKYFQDDILAAKILGDATQLTDEEFQDAIDYYERKSIPKGSTDVKILMSKSVFCYKAERPEEMAAFIKKIEHLEPNYHHLAKLRELYEKITEKRE